MMYYIHNGPFQLWITAVLKVYSSCQVYNDALIMRRIYDWVIN